MNNLPAFPTTETNSSDGMTLRDWFAGQALAACQNGALHFNSEQIAKCCYILADEMLKARDEVVKGKGR